jgi:hypothetical protein
MKGHEPKECERGQKREKNRVPAIGISCPQSNKKRITIRNNAIFSLPKYRLIFMG